MANPNGVIAKRKRKLERAKKREELLTQCSQIRDALSVYYSNPGRYSNVRYSHFVEFGFAVVYADDKKLRKCVMKTLLFEEVTDDAESDSVLVTAGDEEEQSDSGSRDGTVEQSEGD